jgi:hypothetical protein
MPGTTINGTESSPLVTARDAFAGKDADASKKYHDVNKENEEAHQTSGGLLKPIIFGGLDGILTSFAIVAGAAGGRLSPSVVLILGFSNILADALSMGVGEFLSSKAENQWILSERRREEWELENYPEGPQQSLAFESFLRAALVRYLRIMEKLTFNCFSCTSSITTTTKEK